VSVVRAKYGILDVAAADIYHHALNAELMDSVVFNKHMWHHRLTPVYQLRPSFGRLKNVA
jgi:hypothetical protein